MAYEVQLPLSVARLPWLRYVALLASKAKHAQPLIDVALGKEEHCAGSRPSICCGRICCELKCYDDNSSSYGGSMLWRTLLRRIESGVGQRGVCGLPTVCAAG
jgi:hypothetical protein